MTEQNVRTEEYVVSGDKVVATVKELLHESNIRRISLQDEQGKTLIEIPLTLGVIGVLLIPTGRPWVPLRRWSLISKSWSKK